MVVRLLKCIIGILLCCMPGECLGEVVLSTAFPYSLSTQSEEAHPGSTQLLYVSEQHFNQGEEEAQVTIILPPDFQAQMGEDWQVDGQQVRFPWHLTADYGEQFRAIPVTCGEVVAPGTYEIPVVMEGASWRKESTISFRVGEAEVAPAAKGKKPADSWYIQAVTVPVNEDGERDARQEKETVVVPDVTLENMKSRLTGGHGVDWDGILAKPNTYLLLDMRNPKKDTRTIHFRAELMDRDSGEVRPGLIAAPDEAGHVDRETTGTEAALALNGNKMQMAVIPLYVDPFSVAEGDYSLHITLQDGASVKTTELPLHVVKKRSVGIVTLGVALCCLALVIGSIGALKRCILRIGAKGDITVSLFAALAFGGVVVPVTLLGDFLHVILGPFSGLVTGLLSGVVQYLLLMALLILFRQSGVAALFFLMRWLLSAVLFGRVTPAGILICASSLVIIEAALWLVGFYKKKEISFWYGAGVSFLIGCCDAGITFINMEQLMFFYRLYYADWFIGLYMLVNGLLYSTLGSWMGYRIGSRLKQVMGS